MTKARKKNLKLLRLDERSSDPAHASLKGLLRDALRDVSVNGNKYTRGVLVLYGNDGDALAWRRTQAGLMRRAELVGVLTYVLHDLVEEMDV